MCQHGLGESFCVVSQDRLVEVPRGRIEPVWIAASTSFRNWMRCFSLRSLRASALIEAVAGPMTRWAYTMNQQPSSPSNTETTGCSQVVCPVRCSDYSRLRDREKEKARRNSFAPQIKSSLRASEVSTGKPASGIAVDILE